MSEQTIDELIARGEAMEQDDPERAIACFADLAARFPDAGPVIFAYAGAFDSAGHEQEAAEQYRRARELGLPEPLMRRYYVQFGSTLRNNGAFAEAVSLLEEGQRAYPDDVAMGCFLALAQHSAGDSAQALRTTIELVLAAARDGRLEMPRYQRSLAWYAAELTGDAPET